MGRVIDVPGRHATTSGRSKKSSAETIPALISLRQAIKSQDGLLLPRRIRLMVLRSQESPASRTIDANFSSSSSRSVMKADSCMTGNVHQVHIPVKPACARNSVEALTGNVHDLHMPVSAKKNHARKSDADPVFALTFMQAWRKARGLSLEKMAEKLDYSDHTTLSKVERGLVPYSQEILEGYARELKCTVVDLLTRKPGEAEPLLGMWSRLDPQGRKMVEGAVKAATE